MLIDWFTVAAQIVNFLVLIALLKHFLYARIIRAIDARDGKIAASLAEAAEKKEQAKAQLEEYRNRLSAFDQERAGMLAQARSDADRLHTDLLEKARAHVRSLENKWTEDLERERAAFLLDLERRAAVEILAIVRRVVADLACLDVQQCAVMVLLDKIRSLDAKAWKDLARCDLVIRTAFELPEPTRALVLKTLEERLGGPVNVRFERAAGMAWGLELRGGGRKIGWSSETYLESLEEDLKQALEHKAESSYPVVMA